MSTAPPAQDTSGGKQQLISIADLNIEQLSDVRRQLDEELNHLTSSFAQLRAAQGKFKTCVENVREIKPENKAKTILVPLTNSLYVPGKLCDTAHVIVDVGTGYYVKKTRAQAQAHYTTKIGYIQNNLDRLEDTIAKKRENATVVLQLLQDKLVASGQLQAQQAQAAAAGGGKKG